MRAVMRLTLALPFCFALASCAAGSNDPGDGGGGSGAGGSHAGGTRHPSGTAPAMVAGIVGYQYVQPGSGAPKGSVNGLFYTAPQSTASAQYQDLFKGYADVPLDTCVSLPDFSVSSGQPMSTDVGALQMIAPDGTAYPIASQNFFGIVAYAGDVPATAFAPLGKYQLVATGAASPGFSGDFWTPSGLTVEKPASSDVLPVDLAKPLDVAWKGATDGEPVIVTITQLDTKVTCRVKDDGAFTIPASAFLGFSASAGLERPAGAPEHDTITVERAAWYTVGDAAAPVLVLTTTGASYDVDLE
jgi:hypothetical protein